MRKVSPRLIAGFWLVLGIALWNGIFDLYVSRGAREYLQKQREFELRLGPEPSMDVVMTQARNDGIVMSSLWSALVVAGGFATLHWARRGT